VVAILSESSVVVFGGSLVMGTLFESADCFYELLSTICGILAIFNL
jgi:hypothetical protein